jgi:hypothetical protein
MDVVDDDTEEASKDDNQSSEEDMDEEGGALSDIEDDLHGKIPDYVPAFFIDAYRRGKMPATFMDLFTFQIFIVQPQVRHHFLKIRPTLFYLWFGFCRKKIFLSEKAPVSSACLCSATW